MATVRKTVGALALLALALPFLLLSGCAAPGGSYDELLAQKLISYHTEKYKGVEATGTLEDGVRVIRIKATQFSFDPQLIVVNKGERLRLIISSEDVPHGFEIEGFTIPGYNIETLIRKGMPLTLEFVANEEGVWDFICTVYCGFGHSTMKGTFVIR